MKFPLEYNELADYFDALGSSSADAVNHTVETFLKQYRIKSVLDFTCGTGSQVLYLAKSQHQVTGIDISPKLIKIAKSKAKAAKLKIKFLEGDIRTSKVGHFDAVISIFNAIGHLTKKGFEKALCNIHRNLNDQGIYIFDIFNASCLNAKMLATMNVETETKIGDTHIAHSQYSTFDKKNYRLVSHDKHIVQKGKKTPKVYQSQFALQIYTATQLQKILKQNGFKILGQYALDGTPFLEKKSQAILTVAQKI